MIGDDDFKYNIPLKLKCLNSIEEGNLYRSMSPKRARRAGIAPPRPILAILNEFILEKIKRVAKTEPLKANRAMSDLKWVLEDLVEIGHPEFKEAIERIEAFDARLIEKLRKQLVEDYLNASTPPEELDGIRDSLVDLIQRGW